MNQLVFRDGAKAASKLCLPGGSPRATTLILQGSGNVGIDGDVGHPVIGFGFKNKPAKLNDQLSELLNSLGVITFRYNKRGFDDSSQLANQNLKYLQYDALDAATALKKEYPSLPMIVIAFSEGALLTSLIADQLENLDVNSYFLISTPTRYIDSNLRYQFIDWPISLIRSKLDLDGDNIIKPADFEREDGLKKLPFLGDDFQGMEWRTLLKKHKNDLSIDSDIVPHYQQNYRHIINLMNSEAFSPWYESLKSVPEFIHVCDKIKSTAHFYHAKNDPHLNCRWLEEDLLFLSAPKKVHLFDDLGHCMSPPEGSIGQIKTSGPFSDDFLDKVRLDISTQLAFT